MHCAMCIFEGLISRMGCLDPYTFNRAYDASFFVVNDSIVISLHEVPTPATSPHQEWLMPWELPSRDRVDITMAARWPAHSWRRL